MYSSFIYATVFRFAPYIFPIFVLISYVIFYFCCSLHWSMHFCCCIWVSFACVLLFALCQAGDRLLQLERKIKALEQEKSLEISEGTLASLRRYLNRPNSAFDRFEDLPQVLVRLARSQNHQKAEEYAPALDEVRARWDWLNFSELQRLMLGLLGDPVSAKIAKEPASILKSATKASGQTQGGPIRSRPMAAQGRESCFVGGITPALVESPRRRSRPVLGVLDQLHLIDPDHFRADMIRVRLPVWLIPTVLL